MTKRTAPLSSSHENGHKSFAEFIGSGNSL